ncbi:MAG TPA: molybdopterin-synthase adenylyltransferase MoeB [Pseudomonadales bacterium]|jgi:adenylyltransferase/sulfurtransferase|nr:molybdopterin-synthase adenylyltransferase MoeB [Gammaproteobacteria bacterium]MDP6024767.1 molybdopterin-synthase adenylyltransferase MoeB [Pseudomonadales bacterium]MDP6317337.1 molybdopterin-synthase adenylyltransferase MoeB [Pseudomonadales bacterium]MDP7314464.1 molybdopterin-synthase adenylyltransferase MoeB [Pseudomonadales bacterium]HJP51251.1 molybdopterin-synthase adenylyltransferase MoeB [Pseudomonadales bacterium]|tara:strand:+ start:2657 stop:3394 length:738 start_codon:yes stop_codon:yes gene_type:complete
MNDDDLLRYSRQIMLPDIEIEGQEKLLNARVLIIGMGGLGSPVALYLAAAGVGHLVIVDDDVVELSNLQRQIAHSSASIGRSKVDSARDSMLSLNPNIQVEGIQQRMDKKTLEGMINDTDLVIDATDNFETRFDINEICVATKTAAIFGAAVQLEGQILVYDPAADSACYRCLYKKASDVQLNCAENGIAAPVVGVIGTSQAMEAIRILVGIGRSSAGYLQVFDARSMEWRKLELPRAPNCPTCG